MKAQKTERNNRTGHPRTVGYHTISRYFIGLCLHRPSMFEMLKDNPRWLSLNLMLLIDQGKSPVRKPIQAAHRWIQLNSLKKEALLLESETRCWEEETYSVQSGRILSSEVTQQLNQLRKEVAVGFWGFFFVVSIKSPFGVLDCRDISASCMYLGLLWFQHLNILLGCLLCFFFVFCLFSCHVCDSSSSTSDWTSHITWFGTVLTTFVQVPVVASSSNSIFGTMWRRF